MELYIVDGHALAYRSHFAFIRKPLVNSRGEDTGAVFGFTRLLLLLMRKYRPERLAVVFDSGEETERHRTYAAYKANRPVMPDALQSQLPVIRDLLAAFRIPTIVRPGLEADDIIGTLARSAAAKGMDVRIVTGDKDFFQLLSDRIRVIRPAKGTELEDEIGPAYVEERYGLKPAQTIDLLALMGDTSDNIPGVKGIGEKTAVKLLHEYGSLDALLERLDEVEPEHLRRKLAEGRQSALLSRELVTLREAPVDIPIDGLAPGDPDAAAVTELLLRLEFHQILKELSFPSPASAGEEGEHRIVTDDGLEEFARALAAAREFVVDVETTSLDPLLAEIAGISFSVEAARASYVPAAIESASAGRGLLDADETTGIPLARLRAVLGPVLADPGVGKIGHNIKYDALVLEARGMPIEGISFDTMIASYVLDPERRSHSLDNLALEFFRHRKVAYAELFPAGDRVRDIRTVPLGALAKYSCEDADYTMRLKGIFEQELVSRGADALFRSVEMPLCLVLKRMEREGVAVDAPRLEALAEKVEADIARLTREIHRLAGEEFNVNSSKQLQRILFEKLGLKTQRRTKTGYSTDMDVLEELASAHPIVRLILEHRQLSKLLGTYIEALPRLVSPRTGRIHTSFNQTVTATGRLSSSEPNLQNIPIRTELGRTIRSAFVPRPGGLLMDADYSQIELRIMAHLSGDPGFVETYREGGDIHTRTAARIYGVAEAQVDPAMRASAKTINFGVIYGMGPRGLAAQLAIPIDEAKSFIAEYFARYPGVKAYIDGAVAQARERGYAETLLGRRRYLPDIGSEDQRVRSFSERIAVNTPIQGTAADLIKIAMVGIDAEIRERSLASRMILQVHDELVFEVPPAERAVMEELVRRRMEGALALDVPVKVDIGVGANWLEAHP